MRRGNLQFLRLVICQKGNRFHDTQSSNIIVQSWYVFSNVLSSTTSITGCANQFSPQLNPSHFEWLVVADAYQRQSIANIEMNINDADRQNTPCSHVDVAFAADTPPATSSVFFIDSSQIQNQIVRMRSVLIEYGCHEQLLLPVHHYHQDLCFWSNFQQIVSNSSNISTDIIRVFHLFLFHDVRWGYNIVVRAQDDC